MLTPAKDDDSTVALTSPPPKTHSTSERGCLHELLPIVVVGIELVIGPVTSRGQPVLGHNRNTVDHRLDIGGGGYVGAVKGDPTVAVLKVAAVEEENVKVKVQV